MTGILKPRWFHLTPDRLVVLLLAVEGLLWLSDRLGWPEWHKGYAVLVAVASVGVFLLLMFLWFVIALVFRWRFQFSLRSLLILVVAVALPCSWLAVQMEKAKRQQEAVAAIKAGGHVMYDWQFTSMFDPEPPGATWLRNLLEDDFFAEVVAVTLVRIRITNAGMERISGLYIPGSTGYPDGRPDTADITDAGLERVNGLTKLRLLDVSGTEVTDAGLEQLTCLARLQRLGVCRTQVTDEGIEKLRQALPNCQVIR
jgi:hypothetical protein